MERRETTSAVLSVGGRLPVLVLRRDDTDAATVCQHLRRSGRLDVMVVRPADLVRTPLRWPADPRSVPLGLVVLFRDRPATVKCAGQLVDHVGDIPVIGVVEHLGSTVADEPSVGSRRRQLVADLIGAGVEDVIGVDQLTTQVLEHAVVGAIDRRDRGLVHLHEPTRIDGDRTPVETSTGVLTDTLGGVSRVL